jgi:hypothetical protein
MSTNFTDNPRINIKQNAKQYNEFIALFHFYKSYFVIFQTDYSNGWVIPVYQYT